MMLFFVRIPGWVYFWLSVFICSAISACVGKMMGFGYCTSGWSKLVFIILTCIPLVCGMVFAARRAARWNEMGLRYAKYATDDGMESHAAKAAKYFLKAAICKDVDSVINLGLCYAEGFGVERNLEKAVKCYRIAAKESTIAEIALAICYAESVGVEKDMVKSEDLLKDVWLMSASWCERYWNPAEVRTWIHKAAELGSAKQQYQLGFDYEYDVKDEAEAVKWYRKAAERGCLDAQLRLGRMYAAGEGVEKDEAEAVKWYRKAAEQEDAVAQYILGSYYFAGEGVEQNKTEAAKWFLQAAEQGYDVAQFELGLCYSVGEGVEQNKTEAVKWLQEAAKQGNKQAKEVLNEMKNESR